MLGSTGCPNAECSEGVAKANSREGLAQQLVVIKMWHRLPSLSSGSV